MRHRNQQDRTDLPRDLTQILRWGSGVVAGYTHTFTQTGTSPYFCKVGIHRETGVVIVDPPSRSLSGLWQTPRAKKRRAVARPAHTKRD